MSQDEIVYNAFFDGYGRELYSIAPRVGLKYTQVAASLIRLRKRGLVVCEWNVFYCEGRRGWSSFWFTSDEAKKIKLKNTNKWRFV